VDVKREYKITLSICQRAFCATAYAVSFNGIVAKAQPRTIRRGGPNLLNSFYLLQYLPLQIQPNSKAKTVELTLYYHKSRKRKRWRLEQLVIHSLDILI